MESKKQDYQMFKWMIYASEEEALLEALNPTTTQSRNYKWSWNTASPTAQDNFAKSFFPSAKKPWQ